MKDTSKMGRGVASGFHNGASGAYPPCCLKRDGVMYPKPTKEGFIQISAFPAADGPMHTGFAQASKEGKGQEFLINNNDDIYYFPSYISEHPEAIPFLSWGEALFVQQNGREPRNDYEQREAAVLPFNNTIHCVLRVTTKAAGLWILWGADPTKDLNVNVNSSMTQEEYGNALSTAGFIQVFSSYGDFGSNNDTSFSSQFSSNKLGQQGMGPFPGGNKMLPIKGTNWHQNMMFVWSVIMQMNNSSRYTNTEGKYTEFWQHMTSYMSDIHIRGGGDYTKALAPADMPSGQDIKIATEETDPSSAIAYNNANLGHYSCHGHPNIPSNIGCENILTKQ